MIDIKHLKYFKTLVGEENIYSDTAHLRAYSYDATREHFKPDAVIFPKDEGDVSEILKYCNKHQIIIVPRGAGSGFTGGALPSSGGIVLGLKPLVFFIRLTPLVRIIHLLEEMSARMQAA